MSDDIVTHLFEDIPFELNVPALLKRARVKEGSSNAEDLQRLAVQGAALARPKGFYMTAYITGRGADWIEIEGRRFDSRILAVNLERPFRVFPYLATCGQELQLWAEGIEDLAERFWAECVKEQALAAALSYLQEHLDRQYQPGPTSSMNPGSLADWPIQQQQALFALFGARAARIGVRLTESLLMVPTKTVSGIRFSTSEHFESCQLCPRDHCPGRRAPYDAGLFESRYQLDQSGDR